MNAIKREEAMFSMMTDQDIAREVAIKSFGSNLAVDAEKDAEWINGFYTQEVLAGNEPGPDAEDEKMYKRREGSDVT